MNRTQSSQPRIFNALLGSAAIAFVLIAIVLAVPTKSKLENLEFQAQSRAAQHAANSMKVSVSALLAREWQSLGSFSELVDVKDHDSARRVTNAAQRASPGILWAGVAGLDGVVIAGTDGVREGEDVIERKWFQVGLHGRRIGNVYAPHDSRRSDGEDRRFNMSRPILDAAGRTVGVAVYTIRFDWIATHLAESARALDVELAVLDQKGNPLLAFEGFEDDPVATELAGFSYLGAERAARSTSRKSNHVGAYVPALVEGDVPEFGWSMIVRLPAIPPDSILGVAWNSLLVIGLGAFLIIGVVAYLFAAHFLRPLIALIDTADDIASGREAYPEESDSSHEAMVLSRALARVQTTIQGLRFNATEM
ncbi:HAMP domain-containing protein [Maritimibacter sp. DP07]|uniref:HAMP domain-containing protein n=1 Tax=Maritimibacter harenae TaxID=2606218 RepID=A0A845M3A2_9RHOB|nr:cache domain-containing protein [Maritimibacter harenae]MZR12217.1 HAMP domain-containing protein [Maritimibacter harenae]